MKHTCSSLISRMRISCTFLLLSGVEYQLLEAYSFHIKEKFCMFQRVHIKFQMAEYSHDSMIQTHCFILHFFCFHHLQTHTLHCWYLIHLILQHLHPSVLLGLDFWLSFSYCSIIIWNSCSCFQGSSEESFSSKINSTVYQTLGPSQRWK